MRRRWSLVATVLIALLMAPRPARAWDWWDWAQEFSGPGPFTTGNTLNTMFRCPERITASNAEAETHDNCLYFDHRSFDNSSQPDNFGAGEISLHFYEVGLSRRLHPAVEVGFGLGVMDIKPGTHKWTITAPRIIFTPAALFAPNANSLKVTTSDSKKDEILKQLAETVRFYLKLNIMLGDLTAADFGVDPTKNSFHTSFERLASAGFILDGNEIYRVVRTAVTR